MHRADFAVLIAYFATMIVIGALYSRQMRSADMYFAGGKQLSWWLGGVSFLMSSVSALSIVVYAGLGYQYGLVALTLYWTSVPATFLTTWLFARRWRRAGVLTPTEFLEQRFSPGVRQLFVWSGIPLKVADEGLKIVAIGTFVSTGLKLPAAQTMIVLGITILLYAVMGGLWAVVITDLVQFILVTSTVVLLVPLSWRAARGWTHVSQLTPPEFFHVVRAPYGWGYVGSFFILTLLSYSGNWSLIQKFYSARSDDEAAGLGWLACLLFLALPPAWIATGMLARGFISPKGLDPQTLYARVGIALLPPGIMGMILAALFAATMSVLASGYNVIAAVLTLDVYQRLIRRDASQRELVFVGRTLTAIVAILVLAIALLITRLRWTIFDAMIAMFSFLLPPTVLPMLAGLLSTRLSAKGALAGCFSGVAVGLFFFMYRWFAAPVDTGVFQALSIVVPAFSTSIVLLVCIKWSPTFGEARERADAFSHRLTQRSVSTETTLTNPAPIAGLVVGIMGFVLLLVFLWSVLFGHGANPLTASMGVAFVALGALLVLLARRFSNSA
jgi:SSS family solute:Na+ symporter